MESISPETIPPTAGKSSNIIQPIAGPGDPQPPWTLRPEAPASVWPWKFRLKKLPLDSLEKYGFSL